MRNEDQKIQEQIGTLLSTLKRVDPPGDFDFKVRARIAKGRPATAMGSWLPASVRLAIPLGLMLLVGGYAAFDAIYSPESVNVPVVAEIPAADPPPMSFAPVIEQPIPVIEQPVLTSNQTVAAVTDVKSRETRQNRRTARTAVKRTSTTAPATEPGGGSVDIAGREGKTISRPIDPNANIPAKPELASASQISAKDALEKIGVSATFSGGGWKVEAVAAGSTAGRAGVKAGDTIEALNGKPLAEKATVDSGSAAKGVRVRRDGRTIIVGLRP